MTRWYFPAVASVMLLLAVWGFSDNLFWDVDQPSNSDPKFVIHGLFFLLWMTTVCLQALFIQTKNFALHKAMGLAALVIFTGVTVSTTYVFAAIWQGWEAMAPYVKANRVLFASFVILICGAYLVRRRAPQAHKCSMIVGTLFVMEPMISRVFGTMEITVFKGLPDQTLDLYWYFVVFSIWAALFLSLAVHDVLSMKRVHPVTALGIGWWIAVWVAVQFL